MAERGNNLYRVLDRYAGIPLVTLLAARRLGGQDPRRLISKQPGLRRVGVMCLGAIGDLTLLTAIIADLRQALPEAALEVITTSANRSIVPLIPGVSANPVVRLGNPPASVRELRARDYDLLIDAGQWPRISAVFAALSGARATIGFRCAGQHRHQAFDRTAELRADRHELDNFRALVTELGLPVGNMPQLVPSPEHVEQARSATADWGPFVVFHPWPAGFRSHMREWPVQHWRELATNLAAQGYRVVVTGGPDDQEQTAGLVASLPAGTIDFAARSPLPVVAAILPLAEAVISVNTGIMHIACAVGARVIALNGPTNPARWGAVSTRSVNLQPEKQPYGYLHLGSEYPPDVAYTMDTLAPATVLSAFSDLIGRDAS
ncbi:glycosyltransferase family 9 protein [Tistrella mobilis]